jgi:hypothetical protein
MRKEHLDEPLGQFFTYLLLEIEAERDVRRELAERAGVGSSAFKELADEPYGQQLSESASVPDKDLAGIRARISLIAKMKFHPLKFARVTPLSCCRANLVLLRAGQH